MSVPLRNASSSNSDYTPYNEWCSTLKVELKDKSKINVEQRIAKIEEIVNIMIAKTQLESTCFHINSVSTLAIITEIEKKIDLWRGVEIEVCKNKEKKNFSSYQSTARNWFNRNKAKIYGNHLFYEIIFNHILKFCAELNDINDERRMKIFLDIFEGIMTEPVQFPRTKLQPLLPHQTLMQPNRFKKACERFAIYYGMKWISSKAHKRDRGRAKKIHESFVDCLSEIREEISKKDRSSNNCLVPYPFDRIMKETIHHQTSTSLMNLPEELMTLTPYVSRTTDNTDNTENIDDIPPDIEMYDEPLTYFDHYNNDYNDSVLCIDDGLQYLPSMQAPNHQTNRDNVSSSYELRNDVYISPVVMNSEQYQLQHHMHAPAAYDIPSYDIRSSYDAAAPSIPQRNANISLPSYEASRVSHCSAYNNYNVSNRRYSPMSANANNYYYQQEQQQVLPSYDVQHELNTNYNYNEREINYDDEYFTNAHLSHMHNNNNNNNMQSPMPLFNGFL